MCDSVAPGSVCSGGVCLGPRRVFVTDLGNWGGAGGLAGADAFCQSRAGAFGLTGTYLAWVANNDSSQEPRDRMFQSPNGYVRTDGTMVATSWASLISGSLLAPIDKGPNGLDVSGTDVWTNVATSGAGQGVISCAQWTSNSSGLQGRLGDNSSMTSSWTSAGTQNCNQAAKFYCVEQD